MILHFWPYLPFGPTNTSFLQHLPNYYFSIRLFQGNKNYRKKRINDNHWTYQIQRGKNGVNDEQWLPKWIFDNKNVLVQPNHQENIKRDINSPAPRDHCLRINQSMEWLVTFPLWQTRTQNQLITSVVWAPSQRSTTWKKTCLSNLVSYICFRQDITRKSTQMQIWEQ